MNFDSTSYAFKGTIAEAAMSMMREFVRMVGEGKTGKTDASVSVASHLIHIYMKSSDVLFSLPDKKNLPYHEFSFQNKSAPCVRFPTRT